VKKYITQVAGTTPANATDMLLGLGSKDRKINSVIPNEDPVVGAAAYVGRAELWLNQKQIMDYDLQSFKNCVVSNSAYLSLPRRIELDMTVRAGDSLKGSIDNGGQFVIEYEEAE